MFLKSCIALALLSSSHVRIGHAYSMFFSIYSGWHVIDVEFLVLMLTCYWRVVFMSVLPCLCIIVRQILIICSSMNALTLHFLLQFLNSFNFVCLNLKMFVSDQFCYDVCVSKPFSLWCTKCKIKLQTCLLTSRQKFLISTLQFQAPPFTNNEE